MALNYSVVAESNIDPDIVPSDNLDYEIDGQTCCGRSCQLPHPLLVIKIKGTVGISH